MPSPAAFAFSPAMTSQTRRSSVWNLYEESVFNLLLSSTNSAADALSETY